MANSTLEPSDASPTETSAPAPKPVRLIVRRGAQRRYEQLKHKTADMQVDVTWDRREGDRRQTPAAADSERRKSDRRQHEPFTWQSADFVVVVDSTSRKA